jgi:hypothetical protein
MFGPQGRDLATIYSANPGQEAGRPLTEAPKERERGHRTLTPDQSLAMAGRAGQDRSAGAAVGENLG